MPLNATQYACKCHTMFYQKDVFLKQLYFDTYR